MNILLVYRHWAVSSGRYMTDAFKRLGHDVRHIGPAHGRDIWGITVDAKYVHEPDTMLINWRPELVIAMDSDPIMLNLAGTYAEEAPVIVYGVDNHVRDYRRPHFDHYFLAHRGVSQMAWEEQRPMSDLMQQQLDVLLPTMKRNDPLRPNFPSHVARKDMTHLPCAYDPVHFPPSPIPYAERAYDVCMIGVMYPQRWQLVNALKAAGLKVYAGTGLLYEDYRDAYHNARISLCVSANGDVAQRVFETAAMGCAVVSDDCHDFIRFGSEFRHFRDGGNESFTRFKTIDEAVNLAGYLIKSMPQLGEQYAKDWTTWVRPHTWDARAQTIIDWYKSQHAGEAAHENV